MSKVLNFLLLPPLPQIIQQRYRYYKQNNTSSFAAALTTTLVVIGWIFFRFESPAWRGVNKHRQKWFPHINAERPLPADLLRYLIQSLWLLLIVHTQPIKFISRLKQLSHKKLESYYGWLGKLPERFNKNNNIEQIYKKFERKNTLLQQFAFLMTGVAVAILLLLCISQPFGFVAQFVFLLALWMLAMSIRHIPGRIPTMLLIGLSVIVTFRYMWWRFTATLNWNNSFDLICGLLLIVAEIYICLVLVLGYFQTLWPLNRQPVALPEDVSTWPTVDLLITTFNEELNILKPGVYAALGIDWPKDKINIYILDDGNRPEIKAFAAEVGVNYIARATHEHAKAGNINNALKVINGDLIAIFDCDHIPTRAFFQLTVGWFLKDPKLAIVQTPHHFFSQDPFERNLDCFHNTPNESSLFYGLIQDGNDSWDATYFCGSCGIIRRSALDSIGGFAVETVTEDAHTSLRLQRKGYTTAFIRIPLSAGLATESLSAHIGQRMRWARGMVQMLRFDNPLTVKGLAWPQRLCYFNAILYFLSGIPRLIFLTAPLAFLLLHAYILYAPGLMVVLYVLPHIVHAALTNTRIQGKYRHFFWSEIYENVIAWYIALPTTIALINPYKGKFNVTAKGGLVEKEHVDWKIARPYIILLLLNIAGLIAGFWRLHAGPTTEIATVCITMLWTFYNMATLGGALAVTVEAKQIRKSHRVELSVPVAITLNDGHVFSCTLRDYSDNSVGIEMRDANLLKKDDKIILLLKRGQQEYFFPCWVTSTFGHKAGLMLDNPTTQQHIDFIQCTFARSDTWTRWRDSFPEVKPVKSMRDVLILDFRGYLNIIKYSPPIIRTVLMAIAKLIMWGISLAPRRIS